MSPSPIHKTLVEHLKPFPASQAKAAIAVLSWAHAGLACVADRVIATDAGVKDDVVRDMRSRLVAAGIAAVTAGDAKTHKSSSYDFTGGPLAFLWPLAAAVSPSHVAAEVVVDLVDTTPPKPMAGASHGAFLIARKHSPSESLGPEDRDWSVWCELVPEERAVGAGRAIVAYWQGRKGWSEELRAKSPIRFANLIKKVVETKDLVTLSDPSIKANDAQILAAAPKPKQDVTVGSVKVTAESNSIEAFGPLGEVKL